jgi:hypothetical protein
MIAIREPNVTLTKYGEFSVKGRKHRRLRAPALRACRDAGGDEPGRGPGINSDRKETHWGKRKLKRDQ